VDANTAQVAQGEVLAHSTTTRGWMQIVLSRWV